MRSLIGLPPKSDNGRSTIEHPEPDYHPDDGDMQHPGYSQPDCAEPPTNQYEVDRAQQERDLRYASLDDTAGRGQNQIAAAGLEGYNLRQPVKHIQTEGQPNDSQAENPSDHCPDTAEPPAEQNKIQRADEQPRPTRLPND